MLPTVTDQILQALRQAGGVASSAELQKQLGASQPTVSRALQPLVQAGRVRKVGAARSQRYLLPRRVQDVGDQVPVVRIDEHGTAHPFAQMIPLEGGATWVDEAAGVHQRHDGLPWFLADMRPQGFLGRTFANAHPDLGQGNDPRQWSDDDVLRALVLFGDDLPGNLIVGEPAFQRFHSLDDRVTRVASEDHYPALAERAMSGTLPGSSAGGEQPKFCACVAGRHVLVKFSPATDSAVDQRVRDLLVCEHLALATLGAAGLPAAVTRIVVRAGRVFLESRRFDRTAAGRIGMVSLLAYDSEYIGNIDNWAATAQRMDSRRLLRPGDADQLRLLEAYGVLIGNTDRHYGNISLLIEGDDWALSPTYDMLPMLYAPIGGELVPQDFAARRPRPTVDTLAQWPRALPLARSFWHAAATDPRISADFQAIAATNRDLIA
ncbi:type II toxin-antitoxin system HipA family toxin YjjJ [Xylophilus sp. Kf1]|nr:type II toxin-antitoxin system HipA family toxin YjjJ [Xylophilus sp. Kf1]